MNDSFFCHITNLSLLDDFQLKKLKKLARQYGRFQYLLDLYLKKDPETLSRLDIAIIAVDHQQNYLGWACFEVQIVHKNSVPLVENCFVGVFVAPSTRGSGIGSELLEQGERYLAQYLAGINLHAIPLDKKGYSFFEANGFEKDSFLWYKEVG